MSFNNNLNVNHVYNSYNTLYCFNNPMENQISPNVPQNQTPTVLPVGSGINPDLSRVPSCSHRSGQKRKVVDLTNSSKQVIDLTDSSETIDSYSNAGSSVATAVSQTVASNFTTHRSFDDLIQEIHNHLEKNDPNSAHECILRIRNSYRFTREVEQQKIANLHYEINFKFAELAQVQGHYETAMQYMNDILFTDKQSNYKLNDAARVYATKIRYNLLLLRAPDFLRNLSFSFEKLKEEEIDRVIHRLTTIIKADEIPDSLKLRANFFLEEVGYKKSYYTLNYISKHLGLDNILTPAELRKNKISTDQLKTIINDLKQVKNMPVKPAYLDLPGKAENLYFKVMLMLISLCAEHPQYPLHANTFLTELEQASSTYINKKDLTWRYGLIENKFNIQKKTFGTLQNIEAKKSLGPGQF
jgi:hypothetical protein